MERRKTFIILFKEKGTQPENPGMSIITAESDVDAVNHFEKKWRNHELIDIITFDMLRTQTVYEQEPRLN